MYIKHFHAYYGLAIYTVDGIKYVDLKKFIYRIKNIYITLQKT